MKVGTDGVALGSWTDCNGVSHAIDVGCGCGLIALMIAQRCGAKVDAIDIDSGACCDARENIAASPWTHLISVTEMDISDYRPSQLADLIISNPPFFAEGEQAHSAERAVARHEGTLNYSTLIDFATKSLTPNGRLAFIYPFGREDEIIYKAEMSHLKLRRICHLQQTTNRKPIRTMFEFHRIDGPIVKETIAIRNVDGQGYSSRFSELCKDFYLEL
ncbi:MAG: methyltransferase [Muribaculaceae bacterium]|nr:methyltransferase [Muribaculaceae bacterium]